MLISQKCQYALRATLELARRYGEGPVKIAEIARLQAIPPRFLEVILGQLKQGGFVASQRGNEGGYYLVREPASLTMGDIIRFIEGPLHPTACGEEGQDPCSLEDACALRPVWDEAQRAMEDVYDGANFQYLVEEQQRKLSAYAPLYNI